MLKSFDLLFGGFSIKYNIRKSFTSLDQSDIFTFGFNF